MSVKIGISPIAWQNDDLPELTADFTMEQALERMRGLIGFAGDWTDLSSYLPEGWTADPARRRSATASPFAASLELAKQGHIELRQAETFSAITIKRKET